MLQQLERWLCPFLEGSWRVCYNLVEVLLSRELTMVTYASSALNCCTLSALSMACDDIVPLSSFRSDGHRSCHIWHRSHTPIRAWMGESAIVSSCEVLIHHPSPLHLLWSLLFPLHPHAAHRSCFERQDLDSRVLQDISLFRSSGLEHRMHYHHEIIIWRFCTGSVYFFCEVQAQRGCEFCAVGLRAWGVAVLGGVQC